MMKRTDHLPLIVLTALVVAAVARPIQLHAAEKPNVILIMADDQ